MDNRNTFKRKNNMAIFLPLLLALFLVIGMSIGLRMKGGSPIPVGPQGATAETARFNELMNYINARYVDEVDMDGLVDKAIDAVLDDLDPHSNYISPEQLADVNDDLEGNFEGIGVQFMIIEDTIYIISPISGGPSESVGVMAGDKIIEIEDSMVAGVGISNKGVISMLKGEKGTEVKIGVKRGNSDNILPFTIKRDEIPLYSVDASYMLNENTGYIKISRFSATTYDEFTKALETLVEDEGMKDLVIDLRQNPGGYLNAATKILDQLFYERNLLVYTEGRTYNKNEYKSTGRNFYDIGKVSLIIDEGSASASEIMAGAIQDWDRGAVVGRRSFGKGLVQEQYGLSNGGALRLTVARYYTPSDRSIQKPYDDLEAYNEEMYDRYDTGELMNKDSVDLSDSTVYYTKGGRVVYGGGGIMPDIFIPIDSVVNNPYFIQVAQYVPRYVYDYLDKNRGDFAKYETFETFDQNFSVDDAMLSDFAKFAQSEGAKGKGMTPLVKKHLRTRIKAHVARQFFDDKGFYQVINSDDPMVIEAIDALNKSVLSLD